MIKNNYKSLALVFGLLSISNLLHAEESYVIRIPQKLNIGEWVFEPVQYSEWVDNSGAYNCTDWTPDPADIESGKQFSQEQTCSHDMEREVYQYKTNSITGDRILESQATEFETQEQSTLRDAVGTKVIRNMCVDILDRGESKGDGVYKVDPDGAGGEPERNAYCNMSEGGWTLYDNFGTSLLLTGESSPSAYNSSKINSFSDLSSSGYIYALTHVNNTYYHTSKYHLQFFYSGGANGYIKKNLPSWNKGVRVSVSNQWYPYAGYVFVGKNERIAGYTPNKNIDFSPGELLSMTETGILWAESVWIK